MQVEFDLQHLFFVPMLQDFFWTVKHTTYAFASLQLFSYTSGILSERMSHLLVWNRTVNNHDGIGRNISLDLRLEQLNNLLKEMLRCLGVNVTEISAKWCGEAMSILEEIAAQDWCRVRCQGAFRAPHHSKWWPRFCSPCERNPWKRGAFLFQPIFWS